MGSENFNKKLLVEGNEDKHVVLALRDVHNIAPNFEVKDCTGIRRLFETFELNLVKPNQTIGIIVDADENMAGRWQRISDILSRVGIVVPDTIDTNGIILTHVEKSLKIGVWIMPDNNLNGMLEDFMRFLIPNGDNLLAIAEETLSNIETQSHNKYNLIHRPKALIHTWLSWQEIPGKPLGQSITMRYLDTDAEVCLRFVNWIKDTFAD